MFLTVLAYLGAALPAVNPIREQWQKCKAQEHRRHAFTSIILICLCVALAWSGLFFASGQKEAQLTVANRKTEEVRDQLLEQMRSQKQEYDTKLAFAQQDMNGRFKAQFEVEKLTAKGCIQDPALRKAAAGVHPELQRGTTDVSHFTDSVTVAVRRKSTK